MVVRLVPILRIPSDDNQDLEWLARVSLTSFVSFITSTLDPSYVFSPTNQRDFQKIFESTLKVWCCSISGAGRVIAGQMTLDDPTNPHLTFYWVPFVKILKIEILTWDSVCH